MRSVCVTSGCKSTDHLLSIHVTVTVPRPRWSHNEKTIQCFPLVVTESCVIFVVRWNTSPKYSATLLYAYWCTNVSNSRCAHWLANTLTRHCVCCEWSLTMDFRTRSPTCPEKFFAFPTYSCSAAFLIENVFLVVTIHFHLVVENWSWSVLLTPPAVVLHDVHPQFYWNR